MNYRIESDSLGEVKVPSDAYYGAQTQRAVDNFSISGLVLQAEFIEALAIIKKNAAIANGKLGLISKEVSGLIVKSAEEITGGRHYDQFVVDIFQTGSGTSTNMNMNEVIAGRANEIYSGKKGNKFPVHPNDHVNLCQSSNDVIPSAINISVMILIEKNLIPALKELHSALAAKAEEFSGIKKLGRTHLQDAVLMTLGDEFSAYAFQIEKDIVRINEIKDNLRELTIGGTAVGTGINAHPGFAEMVTEMISADTGIDFRLTANHFSSQASQDSSVAVSGILKTIAVSFTKIANDIRWMASGPRSGLGEITLPSLQPGSSIMPGKINPVIPEAVLQVAVQATGNDATITAAAKGGNFELNTMLPLIAYNLIQSVKILSGASLIFAGKCINGIVAKQDKCRLNVENSLDLAVKLIPFIGYDKASAVAKKAYEQDKTIKQVVEEENILTVEQIKDLF